MPRRNEPTERMCVVTRAVLPTAKLIRFVAAPDGSVVADLRHRLPGRGVWVSARADHVRTAVRKRLFARGLGDDAVVAADLADQVAASLADAAAAALSLARKAGTAIAGFGKVESAIAGREMVVGLIHAAEAAEDGSGKLDRQARARFGDSFPVVRLFAGEQLDLAFGRPNVIHAALLAGPASDNVLLRVDALAEFLGEDWRATGIHEPLPERNASAGT